MTLTISAELEQQVRERAEAAGLTISAYVEKLIREDDVWAERPDDEPLEESDPDFVEIQAAINEGIEQIEQGLSTPAEDVFRELRARRGVSH